MGRKKSPLDEIADFMGEVIKAIAAFFGFIYDNITWFILGALLLNTVLFIVIDKMTIFAILNGIIFIVVAIRLYRERGNPSGY